MPEGPARPRSDPSPAVGQFRGLQTVGQLRGLQTVGQLRGLQTVGQLRGQQRGCACR